MCGNVVTNAEFGIGALLAKLALKCRVPPSPLAAVSRNRYVVPAEAARVRRAGEGLNTVTAPVAVKSAALNAAIRAVLLRYCVVRAEPFQNTTAPGTKPEPMTPTLVPAEPSGTHAGLSVAMTGMGFEVSTRRM